MSTEKELAEKTTKLEELTEASDQETGSLRDQLDEVIIYSTHTNIHTNIRTHVCDTHTQAVLYSCHSTSNLRQSVVT